MAKRMKVTHAEGVDILGEVRGECGRGYSPRLHRPDEDRTGSRLITARCGPSPSSWRWTVKFEPNEQAFFHIRSVLARDHWSNRPAARNRRDRSAPDTAGRPGKVRSAGAQASTRRRGRLAWTNATKQHDGPTIREWMMADQLGRSPSVTGGPWSQRSKPDWLPRATPRTLERRRRETRKNPSARRIRVSRIAGGSENLRH